MPSGSQKLEFFGESGQAEGGEEGTVRRWQIEGKREIKDEGL